METIEFKGDIFPHFQCTGNASQFSIPFAKHFCKGTGYDIGYCRDEWKFPNSIGIDLNDSSKFHADLLPEGTVDYIYSSHCLEHVDSWVKTFEYWLSKIKPKGILFLYLPDISQTYWRPWNNKKHRHVLTPMIFKEFCLENNLKHFISGIDLNNSFMVVIENSDLVNP
jgi:SAM-dependent methyltransferase